MSDLFRCDYCGQYAPIDQGTTYWSPAYQTDDGDQVFTAAVYCSTPCGRMGATANARVGA